MKALEAIVTIGFGVYEGLVTNSESQTGPDPYFLALAFSAPWAYWMAKDIRNGWKGMMREWEARYPNYEGSRAADVAKETFGGISSGSLKYLGLRTIGYAAGTAIAKLSQ